ncbi:hypothetical protein ETU08_08820 [Apibacter muscae]|uniref:Uncharacterized protein n=1 Tax=Apibacter muscae TaxID=2509004 RepID=A0A563DAR9_9FLAO|nr:hypothetical protein [Apibacter muscae]TWP23237.1 hypothetical protein ETU10_07745 [Apibacter muscae]TWP27315.1 hypothetical protein ETU09_07675 [Apibacter muscae]TWP28536.1 hypothetical protein ETU08_08820 [Apibacter muscae]
MIKQDLLDNIIDVFQKDVHFEYIDFKINIIQDTLNITSLINPEHYIMFQDKNHFKEEKDEYEIYGECVPGRYSSYDSFTLNKKTDVYEKIKIWLESLWNEISLKSPLKIIEEEQEEINKICEKFNDYENDYFTTEEILKAKEELNKLRRILGIEIMNIVDEEQEQKKEFEMLYSHFDSLEKMLPSLRRKGWARSLTGRVFHNVKRVLEQRQKKILENANLNFEL